MDILTNEQALLLLAGYNYVVTGGNQNAPFRQGSLLSRGVKIANKRKIRATCSDTEIPPLRLYAVGDIDTVLAIEASDNHYFNLGV